MRPDEIASRTGLSTERVFEILAGAKVGLSELRALSRGLRIPLQSFAAGVRAIERNESTRLLFRSIGDVEGALDPTKEFVADFVEAALEIMPARERLPDWLQNLSVKAETYREAERLAYEVRKIFFGDRFDEPIPDLAEVLARDASIIVGRLHLSRYEGVSLISGNYAFIFVSPRFLPRMLFTVAHELGHIVAHHTVNYALFERPTEIQGFGSRRKAEGFVDAFASVLLMPERGVGQVLKKVRSLMNISSNQIGDIEILLLARFFGVSFEVAARRCEALDLIPAGGARSLIEVLRRSHSNPEKRADEVGLPSRESIPVPILSDRLLEPLLRRLDEGVISAGWAADRFGVSINDIYAAHAKLNRELRH